MYYYFSYTDMPSGVPVLLLLIYQRKQPLFTL